MHFLRSDSRRWRTWVWLLALWGSTNWACQRPYRNLTKTTGNAACVAQFKPIFTKALYKTQVTIIGKQLSGLLLFKTMPDSSLRLVFSSEMGFKFFDFEFTKNGVFKTHYVLKQMDKPLIINTLKSDFELILMKNLVSQKVTFGQNNETKHHIFENQKATDHYITNVNCTQLLRIEKIIKHKIKVRIMPQNYQNGLFDSIGIAHQNFNLQIGLKRLE